MSNADAAVDAESLEDINLAAILDRAAFRWGSRTAVVCGDRSFTYAEFAGRAGRLARCLQAEGVAGGCALAMIHRNCHLVLEAYFAAAALGAMFVPLNVRLSDRLAVSLQTGLPGRCWVRRPRAAWRLHCDDTSQLQG